MIEDSSTGFVDAASVTHKVKQRLLCQATHEEKAQANVKAQADAKAMAAEQTPPVETAKTTMVKRNTFDYYLFSVVFFKKYTKH